MMQREEHDFIVSNNPAVWELFPGTEKIFGSPLDVMREVRDHVHRGWKLVGHPLMGSIRLLRNPYRSVVMGTSCTDIDIAVLLQVEDACRRLSEVTFDTASSSSLCDYQIIDLELIKTAIGLAE